MLGLTLRLDETAQGYFNRHYEEACDQGMPEMGMDQAFQALERGIAATLGLLVRDEQIVGMIPDQADMTFNGLKTLIHRASARKQS
jgi:hypothetical protein